MSFKVKTTTHEIINLQLMFIIYFAVKIMMTHNIFVFSSELMTFQKDKKRGEEEEEEKKDEGGGGITLCMCQRHTSYVLTLFMSLI
jgi:amino acid permease